MPPYLVVYEDPADTLPARIYFYDSNAPENDGAYMTITEDGDTVEFDYSVFDSPSDSYLYSTATDWTLGSGSIGFVMGDVSLPLSPL